MNPISQTFKFGSHNVTLTTGEMARQSSGSVVVDMSDTVVLATVVAEKEARSGQSFFPLTVDYVEKTYSAGKIPGGFFKREGRPSEKEILTSRLIDRPIRPLFPKGFYNDVQVIIHVLSLNPEVDPDIPAMIGASAALSLSGVPFEGPVGAARVGYIGDEYVLCPDRGVMADSQLDLVVAGTSDAVLMVESQANELSEEIMLGAVNFGHESLKAIVNAIVDLVKEAGSPAWDYSGPETNTVLIEKISDFSGEKLAKAYAITDKQERVQACRGIKSDTIAQFCSEEDSPSELEVNQILFDLESGLVRNKVLSGEPRIDGRDTRTVRPISIRQGVLPRAHGSSLFTRGETQALVVATLGTARDEQMIDSIQGEYRDRFMFHYNMPPFATGEAGRFGSPKRREIGHGRLARRSIEAVLPSEEDFSYTMRLVSEILESNGSSSMASVCGASLALINAGVPIKSPVAGIAMGLIKEGNRFAVLTDILGDEDHLGDMDFKVAGTEKGITALQMDIKIQGITSDIMSIALEQAQEARMHILGKMIEAIKGQKSEISQYAPRMIKMKVNPDKIRDIIGKGGATIRALTEETNCVIDVQDDGTVTVSSVNAKAADMAKSRIEALTAEVELNKIYEGTVIRLLDFGAIVEVLPGKDGLVHISQITQEHVESVGDHLKEGQKVKVKVIETDDKGRVRLSMKAVKEDQE